MKNIQIIVKHETKGSMVKTLPDTDSRDVVLNDERREFIREIFRESFRRYHRLDSREKIIVTYGDEGNQ
jgi:hypothetical protein